MDRNSFEFWERRSVEMEICKSGGCMAKLPGSKLIDILNYSELCKLGQFEDSALLNIGCTDLLFTTDFGPVVGTTPEDAGTIAVLNAISDIYAMGGIPLYALIMIIIGNDLDDNERKCLLETVQKTCKSENVIVVGGHSIIGDKTVVGLSVIGKRGENFYKKTNGKLGDILLLTKPLGTGLGLQAYYNGQLGLEAYFEIMGIMKKSNKLDEELLKSDYIHSITDVTGFGLVGHLSEMLSKNQGAIIFENNIPILKCIGNLSYTSLNNEYIANNIEYARERKRIRWHLDSIKKIALCDPQTNGPLLISADRRIFDVIKKYNVQYIGEIVEGEDILLQ